MFPKKNENSQLEIGQLIEWATLSLVTNSSSPRLDAEVLMAELTHYPRSTVMAFPERMLSQSVGETFQALVELRGKGVSIAHLTGHKEFYSLDLKVSSNTLVPRPETEMLVDGVLSKTDPLQAASILDLGTGCGAIALAIKKQRPNCRVVAVDLSLEALRIAAENGCRLGLEIEWLCSRWLTSFGNYSFDFIVSNPPYVARGDDHLLSQELSYEPSLALDGGTDGLDSIREIIASIPNTLATGGMVFLEHGHQQALDVSRLLQETGFSGVETKNDLAGCDRMTLGNWL